jgi:hypothetical protein
VSTAVEELFALLGLKLDKDSFETGHQALDKLSEKVGEVVKEWIAFEAAKEGAEFLKDMVQETMEAAEQARNLSQQLGISAEAVQELQYAAHVSDVPIEVLNGAMQRLARGLEQVGTTGKGPAADALAKLGVKARDLKGENLEQNLDVLADAFKKLPDGAHKAALATELFGRSAGPRMLLLLNKGSEGIAELRNEAEDLGYVMGGEALEQTEELEVAQKRLGATLTGLRNTFVSELLPTFIELAKGLQEYIKAHRPEIVAKLKAVAEALAKVFIFVGKATSKLAGFVEVLSDNWDIARIALLALGVAFAPLFTAFALVVEYGEDIMDDVIMPLERGLESVGESVGEAFNAVLDGVKSVIEWISDKIDWIVKKAKAAAEWVDDQFSTPSEDVQRQVRAQFGMSTDEDRAFMTQAAMPTPMISAPGSSSVFAPTIHNETHVHVPAGTDAKGVADVVGQANDDWFSAVLRDAHAATSR